MQSSPSPGLDLAETTRPQPPLLPLQFSSFPPTPEQCHIPQPGFLAPSPACTEFVGLQARQSRAKEQLGLPGRSLPCGHLVLAPHLVLGAAFVPGPAAVWVQLCTQRGAEQPWVVALHSWGAPGRSGGDKCWLCHGVSHPILSGARQSRAPGGPLRPVRVPVVGAILSAPSCASLSQLEGCHRASDKPLLCLLSRALSSRSQSKPRLSSPPGARAAPRDAGTGPRAHGGRDLPSPEAPQGTCSRWSLPSLPSQGLGVLKGSRPPIPGLASQDPTVGRAWSCPPQHHRPRLGVPVPRSRCVLGPAGPEQAPFRTRGSRADTCPPHT